MAAGLQYLAVVVAGLVLYGLGRAILSRVVSSGSETERADRAQADLFIAKRQGEVMAEHRDVNDALRDLDNARF